MAELPESPLSADPFLMAAILLIGVIARLPTLVNSPMWWDEIWTMWQTQGSLAQAIRLTPYNWPPGYYALMQIWTSLVGHNDIIGRCFSLLCGLLSIALMYRVGQTIAGDRRTGIWIGGFAALLTAVLPYTAYMTIEARGYALFAVALPLTLWLHIRFLRRPIFRRAIGYGLALTFCLYASYIGLIVIGLSLAHSLIWTLIARRLVLSDRRAALIWSAAPGVLIVSAIPLALNLISIIQLRRQNIADRLAPPGIDNLPLNFAGWLVGGQPIAFAIIFIAALIGLIGWLRATRWQSPLSRDWRRLLSFLAVWALLAPIILIVFRYWLLLVAVRYLYFIVPGIILVIALGLSRWPRALRLLISLPILLYAVAPMPVSDYRPQLDSSSGKPLRDLVRELGKRYQAGDTVWVDPKCACGEPIEWSYFSSIYFPGGIIPKVTDLSQAGRRIWYISDQQAVMQANIQALTVNRSHTEFFGPPYLIADLYEAPPRTVGLPIGSDLRFYGIDLPRVQPVHPGDTITIRLWWSIATSAPHDNIVTLTLRDPGGQIIAQRSTPPQGIPAPLQPVITMSQWQPGKLYVDDWTFSLPTRLAGGHYPLQIAVKDASGQPLIPDSELGNTPEGMVSLGTVDVFNTPDQLNFSP